MGVRNILVLFFSTMAVSLVILIILFNLIFKNIDMTFETKIPESAPTIDYPEEEDSGNPFSKEEGFSSEFKARGVHESKIDVPGGSRRQVSETSSSTSSDTETEQAERPTPESPVKLLNPEPVPELKSTPKSDPKVDVPKGDALRGDAKSNSKRDLPAAHRLPRETSPEVPKMAGSAHRTEVRLKPPIPTSSETSGARQEQEQPAQKKTGLYQVYIDGFSSEAEARSRVSSLQARGVEAFVTSSGNQTVVRLGTYSSEESAQRIARENGAKIRKMH